LDSTPTDRDTNGRFAPGNRGGPGRPRGRGDELRQAAEDAVTPEHVGALMRRALRMALEGNLAAMRFVMERVCGRSADAPAQPAASLELELPRLNTAADCNAALQLIADGIAAGTLDREATKMLTDVIMARLKAIEVGDLEKRLGELEAIADTVEHRGPRRVRRS
jgi:hypothetical protein